MNKISIKRLSAITGLLTLFIVHSSLSIAHSSLSPIVINEIQYHPASDDHGEEYVELFNTSAITVDVSGWRFSDGIEYTFPLSTSVLPGGYAVVASDPATVEAIYGISGVLGPFTGGRLANEGERVALEDDLGVLVDEVVYDDHRPWPELPDGDGPSLELVNPTFDNKSPCSWGASQPPTASLGSPGVQNSVYSPDNTPPCITDVMHTPAFPTSNQAVTVTVMAGDNITVSTVTVHYRPEGAPAYLALPMVNDGGGFSATIPANEHEDGLYVEFYVTATDDQGAERIAPDGAPGGVSYETGRPVSISYLYQVEDRSPTDGLPIYRLIVTQENWAELTTRDLFSNVLLDATFVYSREVFYNVGVRYRGEGSRNTWPSPYRIKFNDEHEFEDRERLNLVSDELGREALSHDLFRRVGLAAPDTRFIAFYINESKQGDYLDIEQVDNDFLQARFPGDDSGNLYRGYDGSNLSYRGPDPDSYRPHYLKKNNEDADDYSDIIALTDVLTNSPDETLRANSDSLADMRQWMRWFAVHAVLDNHEGALWIGGGDDYFLYHRPSDDRFILISWDHDSTFLHPDHGIWEPNWYASEIVRRILNHPPFTRWYFQGIASITADEFSVAEMYPRIDALPDVVDGGDKNYFKWFVSNRSANVNGEIPGGALSISTNGGANIVTTMSEVTLEGECSPLRDVSVNGNSAAIQYPTVDTWHYSSTLWGRDNVFVVADGLDSLTLAVYRDLFHGGVLTDDFTLQTSSYPYRIDEDIVVPTGVTLTIEPGATLQFQAGRALRVQGGRLLAVGAAAQPIVFTRHGEADWDGIVFSQTLADNRIRYAEIEYTRGISASGAVVSIEDSKLHDVGGDALTSNDAALYLRRNEIANVQGDGVRVTGGYALVQGNDVHNVSANCLELDGAPAIIERNRLHGCDGAGIAAGHLASTTVVNNLVYSNTHGITVTGGASAHIANNTVADNRGDGIRLYGGGTAAVVNSIVWGNGADLKVDAMSAITVTYSNVYTYVGAGTVVWPGEGNINADPLFRAPQSSYRLVEESPCVDAGTAASAPGEDIWGIYRPHGAKHDMGAHEFFEYFDYYLPLVLRAGTTRTN